MMHPCAGTIVPGPAVVAPTPVLDIYWSPASANQVDARTASALGRAPPWALWALDRSVALRV